jgi:hypothetical protein
MMHFEQKPKLSDRLRDSIEAAALRLNGRLSKFDWFLNENNGILTRALRLPHPVSALLLLSLVAWVCIHGPILPYLAFDLKVLFMHHLPMLHHFRGAGELVLCVIAVLGIWTVLRISRRRADPLVSQPVLLLALLLLVYLFASPAAAAAQNALYQHVYMPVIAGVAISATFLPRFMASSFIQIYKRHYAPEKIGLAPLNTLLPRAQFLADRPPPEAGALQIFLSLLTPFYYPFRLLFPVAIAVLIAPYGEFAVYGSEFIRLLVLLLVVAVVLSALLFKEGPTSMAVLKHVAAGASMVMIPASLFFIFFRFFPFHVHFMSVYAVLFGITAWMVLTVAGIDTALNASLKLSSRLFFSGGKWLLSLGVIALALFRFIQIDYVTTVLNSQSKAVIFGYISAAYAILWLYDYWIDRTMAEKLLPLLIPTNAEVREKIRYRAPVDPDKQNEGRWIEIYGGGRFVVTEPQSGRYEAHSLENFFYRVVYGANPGVDPARIEKGYGVDRLKRFVRFYTLTLNAVPFLIAGLVIAFAHRDSLPELQAETTGAKAPAMNYPGLRESIFAQANDGTPRKLVLVAASGGGTRAALFTASVLRGLWAHGAIEKVDALSGVSGGSAAIAYFAIHREELRKSDADRAWRKYFGVMSAPFIDDVLEGMSELRTVSGIRTGILLKDSFINRMEPGSIQTIGECPIGLIFNTTRAGQQLRSDGRLGRANSEGAGAPFIFTNINPCAFEHSGRADAPALCLSSMAIPDPGVRLTTAAALSANFPPVFSNAAVDVTCTQNGTACKTRYWVTDGGASENRGIISLLYALRFAMSEELDELKKDPQRAPRAMADIHIIVADASAEDTQFVQDRGITSAFAAADNYANQLSMELSAQIDDLCRQIQSANKVPDAKSPIHFHYLGMPDVLRVSGSVGTHWMLAGTYTIHHHGAGGSISDHTVLRGKCVRALIAGLHTVGTSKEDRPSSRNKNEIFEQNKVRGWITADGYDAVWSKTIEDILSENH